MLFLIFLYRCSGKYIRYFIYSIYWLETHKAFRPINSENNPLIELEDYLVEMVITENSMLIDKRALDFRNELDTDTALIGQIDENGKKIEIHGNQKLYEGQVLILKINPDMVADIKQEFGLDIDSEKRPHFYR